MKEKSIHVLKVDPMEHPVKVTLENNLTALQEAVSIGADYAGLIEIVEIENNVCVLLNEEGKLIGLPGNRSFGNDIFCGVFYVTGEDKEGNLASLPEEAIQRYTRRFWIPECFSQSDVENTIFTSFGVFQEG